MTPYAPARQLKWFASAALVLAVPTGWFGWTAYRPALIPALLFLLTGSVLLALALSPKVAVHEGYLAVGRRVIPWMDIRRLDYKGWTTPLAMWITLYDDSRLLLLYAGEPESRNNLLRQIRRFSRDALIDGVPYRQYWGEVLTPARAVSTTDESPMEAAEAVSAPRFRLLRPEDEAEVETLYRLLKTAGTLDPKKSSDEK